MKYFQDQQTSTLESVLEILKISNTKATRKGLSWGLFIFTFTMLLSPQGFGPEAKPSAEEAPQESPGVYILKDKEYLLKK